MIEQKIIPAHVNLHFVFFSKYGKPLKYSVLIELKYPYIEEITIAREKLSHEVDGYRLISVSRELII